MCEVDAKGFKFLCSLYNGHRDNVSSYFCNEGVGLIFGSVRVFDRGCISRFQDCPLCGLDIDSIESDPEMQGLVDRFIEGHARTKRPSLQTDVEKVSAGNIKYEDISVERGSFLVQQAMRVSISFCNFKEHSCIDSQV